VHNSTYSYIPTSVIHGLYTETVLNTPDNKNMLQYSRVDNLCMSLEELNLVVKPLHKNQPIAAMIKDKELSLCSNYAQFKARFEIEFEVFDLDGVYRQVPGEDNVVTTKKVKTVEIEPPAIESTIVAVTHPDGTPNALEDLDKLDQHDVIPQAPKMNETKGLQPVIAPAAPSAPTTKPHVPPKQSSTSFTNEDDIVPAIPEVCQDQLAEKDALIQQLQMQLDAQQVPKKSKKAQKNKDVQ
jgi:hypothetical protein